MANRHLFGHLREYGEPTLLGHPREYGEQIAHGPPRGADKALEPK